MPFFVAVEALDESVLKGVAPAAPDVSQSVGVGFRATPLKVLRKIATIFYPANIQLVACHS
jgi:hypothetical protein